MSRQLFEEARKVLIQEAAVKLDPVGQEDKDIDNDGDADKTDSYLKKRRGAISAAIAKSKNESALSEEDLAKLQAILGEMKKKEEMEDEEEGEEDEESMKSEGMQKATVPPKGPKPGEVPAYLRKDNARQKFPIDLKDLKKEEVDQIDEKAKWRSSSAAEPNPEHDPEEYAYDKLSTGSPIRSKADKPLPYGSIQSRQGALVATSGLRKGMVTKNSAERLKARIKANLNIEEVGEYSHQAKTTMKHIPNPTAGEKSAAKDIKPGVAGYRDRIAMLKSAEARGGLKKEESEGVAEDFELIEKLNFEIPENPSYQDYFKAALKIAQVESFSELDEEDQQYIMNEMEIAYRDNDNTFILEADLMGDMNDTVQRLRKAGHKVEDMGRDFKGNPFYTYVDKGTNMRRKVTYKGTQKVTQNMGRAKPEKEEE